MDHSATAPTSRILRYMWAPSGDRTCAVVGRWCIGRATLSRAAKAPGSSPKRRDRALAIPRMRRLSDRKVLDPVGRLTRGTDTVVVEWANEVAPKRPKARHQVGPSGPAEGG